MPLNSNQIKSLQPGPHSDGGGLYLVVRDSGERVWAFRFTDLDGKRAQMEFAKAGERATGKPGERSLQEAREMAGEYRVDLRRNGIDPRAEKRAVQGGRTFKEFAEEHYPSWCKGPAQGRTESLGALDQGRAEPAQSQAPRDHQLLHLALDPRSIRAMTNLRAIEFAGDQLAEPSQDSVRPGDGCYLGENLTAHAMTNFAERGSRRWVIDPDAGLRRDPMPRWRDLVVSLRWRVFRKAGCFSLDRR
jgi:hypothetical protein